jgi:hypothetical protein
MYNSEFVIESWITMRTCEEYCANLKINFSPFWVPAVCQTSLVDFIVIMVGIVSVLKSLMENVEHIQTETTLGQGKG